MMPFSDTVPTASRRNSRAWYCGWTRWRRSLLLSRLPRLELAWSRRTVVRPHRRAPALPARPMLTSRSGPVRVGWASVRRVPRRYGSGGTYAGRVTLDEPARVAGHWQAMSPRRWPRAERLPARRADTLGPVPRGKGGRPAAAPLVSRHRHRPCFLYATTYGQWPRNSVSRALGATAGRTASGGRRSPPSRSATRSRVGAAPRGDRHSRHPGTLWTHPPGNDHDLCAGRAGETLRGA